MKPKKLSFALRFKDAFAPLKPLISRPTVALIGRKDKAIRNKSGLYCFSGLTSGIYSIGVQAQYYCNRLVEIDMSSIDPKMPAVDVIMSPNLNYPFPKGTTLLRGIVGIKNAADSILNGVRVIVEKSDKKYVTDERGRFIFYFIENKDDEKKEEEIELLIANKGYKTTRRSCVLKKYSTNNITIKLEPN